MVSLSATSSTKGGGNNQIQRPENKAGDDRRKKEKSHLNAGCDQQPGEYRRRYGARLGLLNACSDTRLVVITMTSVSDSSIATMSLRWMQSERLGWCAREDTVASEIHVYRVAMVSVVVRASLRSAIADIADSQLSAHWLAAKLRGFAAVTDRFPPTNCAVMSVVLPRLGGDG